MRKILIISGQDYRSKRKVNVHFYARALAKNYAVTQYSTGYSWLSQLIGRDPRIGIKAAVNKPEIVDSIECYLDKRSFHPGGFAGRVPPAISDLLFKLYMSHKPEYLMQKIRESDIIIVESGIACIFLDLIFEVNSAAKVVYLASDDLQTIGVAPYVQQALTRNLAKVSLVSLPSELLAPSFVGAKKVIIKRHGINKADFPPTHTPYSASSINAVSVGSMLFDDSFFEFARNKFPHVNFHIIGSGSRNIVGSANVFVYQEMPFKETIRYVEHCNIGLAPYKAAKAPFYLSDTSMKLIQFDYLGKPSVCPYFAVGNHFDKRFGYTPSDGRSIVSAINAALLSTTTPFKRSSFSTWDELAANMVESLDD